jgi:hypothetical protein
VLFGGANSSVPTTYFAGTWEWDGSAWNSVAPAGSPQGRIGSALVYDLSLQKALLFGGNDGASDRSDTWTFDGNGWTLLAPATAPSGRHFHAMAYDAVRRRAVLFGGEAGTTVHGDTWEWDGTNWLQRVTNQPPARSRHAMTWDARRNRVLMTNGRTATLPLADAWEWDGTSWAPVVTAANPGPRAWHATVFDTMRNQVITFGGTGSNRYLRDTWAHGDASSYASHGAGCPGSLGVPTLAARAGSAPMPGSTLLVDLANLPFGTAVMAMGFSDRSSGPFTLPLDLGPFGMNGCRLLVDPLATLLVTGPNQTATWSLYLPQIPGLASLEFFNQAFVLDPGINPAGVTVSNGGRARVGY